MHALAHTCAARTIVCVRAQLCACAHSCVRGRACTPRLVPFPQVLVSFTGNLHLRHPFNVGGALWLATIVLGQVSCVIGALVYWQYYQGPGKIAPVVLFAIVSALLLLTSASGFGLRLLMHPAYIHTFCSAQTGRGYSMAQFLDNEGVDEARIKILGTNESLWRPIRREVKEWVVENYEEWTEKHWFTAVIRAQVPVEFLPKSVAPDIEDPSR